MRESIGGLWIFSIVIVFMMVLIAFVAISINYNNVYRLKTAMITKIEQYDGWNTLTQKELDGLIYARGYRQTGYCQKPSDGSTYIGVYKGVVTKNTTTKQSYCIYRTKKNGTDTSKDKYYYHLTIFLGFNLPVLGDIFTFKISGETGEIRYPSSDVTF